MYGKLHLADFYCKMYVNIPYMDAMGKYIWYDMHGFKR